MTHKFRSERLALILISLVTVVLVSSACTTETVEVTRIKVLERRVIERVPVTVEVTRIHRIIETPTPTADEAFSDGTVPTDEASPTPPPPTDTAVSIATAAAPPTAVPSVRQEAEGLLSALQDTEQSLLALVQALNSEPIPVDQAVVLFDALSGAPTFSIPDEEAGLQSIYIRYREQLDNVSRQGADLYAHLAQIQAGEATQTEVRPTHLSLAQAAASAATSTVQALLRELEALLAPEP